MALKPFSISSIALVVFERFLRLVFLRRALGHAFALPPRLACDQVWPPIVWPAAATSLRISGCHSACLPMGKNIALTQCSASASSTARVLTGQGPSSNVSTTSFSTRKSWALYCSKPKPGPPVVSTSTVRARPSALGLCRAGVPCASAGAADAAKAMHETVIAVPKRMAIPLRNRMNRVFATVWRRRSLCKRARAHQTNIFRSLCRRGRILWRTAVLRSRPWHFRRKLTQFHHAAVLPSRLHINQDITGGLHVHA